jgi:excinuclease ABC subunit A
MIDDSGTNATKIEDSIFDGIVVRRASENNLRGIDVDIPRGRITVITGVSGSGKSSLAFDVIFREAQRRYMESFPAYARRFLGKLRRPDVAHVTGLSPAIAVSQRAVTGNPRSTVGTLTELYDILRLLYARLGDAPQGVKPERSLFSFNSPRGACPVCKGLGIEDRIDPDLLLADPSKSLREGALVITTPSGYVIYSQVTMEVLDRVCHAHGFGVDIPWKDLTDEQKDVVLNGSDRVLIPFGKHPLASRMRWKGITARPREEGRYKGILPVMEAILRQKRNRNILRFARTLPCRACGGRRLRPEALSVAYRGRDIAETSRLSVGSSTGSFGCSNSRAGKRPPAPPSATPS